MEIQLIITALVLTAGAAAQFSVTTTEQQLVAAVGSTITLPCTVSPPLPAAGLEVRWFHGLYHSVVFLLKDGREDRQQQLPNYRGRVSLLAGPDKGDLSISLQRVQLADNGTYHCFVENTNVTTSQLYEEGKVELKVVGVGTPPLIKVSVEDSSVVLSCSSDGWFPTPTIFWRNGKGYVPHLAPESRKNDSSGLFHIHSDIHLGDSALGQLYCGLQHPVTKEERGVYVVVSDEIFPRFSPWAIVFWLLLVLSIAGFATAAWYFRKKQKEKERELMQRAKYTESLEREIEWRKISTRKEFILFDPLTAFKGLLISPDQRTIRTTDVPQEAPENEERFDTEPCVLCQPAFSSGIHYWETEIVEETERFWSIGIAAMSVRRKGGLRESPENLIWAIRGTSQGYLGLSMSAEEILLVQMPQPRDLALLGGGSEQDEPRRIQKIGTYLDFNRGHLSFYDVETYQCLYTFNTQFHEPVYPFYYVGPGIAFNFSMS
ncbi:butyrophilin subfamily 1 member A1-like [Hyperolius riggenbachi]|uniref:butyrophilin subfamily 1 member A1-like n=1 Tax=Hyperolius riggenbachi TaxID=752182 RepID=UPI0035A28EDC